MVAPQIEAIAKDINEWNNLHCLGSGETYPIALEGALKLKKICLRNNEGSGTSNSQHEERKMDATPIEVTDATFDQSITQPKKPVIVDFWAPWCPACRVYAPVIDELANKFHGRIVFAKVNSDQNPVSKTKYGIEAIPTLLFFSNGQVVQTHVGALEQEQLRDLVKEFLKVI